MHSAQTGGSQEGGLRAGTHNVPLIAGMGQAHTLATERWEEDSRIFSDLRDGLIRGVLDRVPGALVTGHPSDRLPNHTSFVFPDVDGNALLAALDLAGFACSSGSACKTGDPEPSEVLTAMGMDPDLALGSLRVTVGRQTTDDEVEAFIEALPETISRLSRPVVSG